MRLITMVLIRPATVQLLFCCIAPAVWAQQTVFNVPTTDVLDSGKVYFELDISAKPNNSLALPRFSSFVPRLIVGVGRNIELGLNLLGNIQPGVDPTILAPAVKWRIYHSKKNGWAVAVGNNLFIPVRNRSYNVGTFSYVMVQKTWKTNTRLGFGGNLFSKHVVAPNATRAGAQFSFEQRVTKNLNLNGDWLTGKHANGYFTSGFAYKLSKKLAGVAAYSAGNAKASKGNHFLYFEIGYNLN